MHALSSHKNLMILDGRKLGDFALALSEVKQLRLSGWKGIKVSFLSDKGEISDRPVIHGIYSAGGKDGIKPWMDIDYREEITLSTGNEGKEKELSLKSAGLDGMLFFALSELIPPGGHLMVSYEGDDRVHMETLRGLYGGVPPAATPIGSLLFKSGFHYIKDWYLAEGGHEGPRKLWGEKALNEASEEDYLERSKRSMESFLHNPPPVHDENILHSATLRANEILALIYKP